MRIGDECIKAKDPDHVPNHSHAWRGSWNRPMLMDEDTLHPFDVARMTDHNVRGVDRSETDQLNKDKNSDESDNSSDKDEEPFRFGF